MSTTTLLGNLPERIQCYVSRSQDLDAVKLLFEQTTTPQILLITGLGGCGKTQLASRFAHTAKLEQTYELISWFSISDSVMQQAALMTIAKHIEQPPSEHLSKIFLQCLQNLGRKHEKSLLIFDDAYDLTLFKELLESESYPKNVHILVTSRHSMANSPQIELDVFTEEECLRYVNRSFPEATQQDIKKLSAQLGSLPLAMCQAVSYMLMTSENIDGYLSLYQEQSQYKQHLLDLPIDSYNKTIWTTWDVSINDVLKSCPLAAKVLRFFYYLYSDKIPKSLLNTVWKDRLELNEALSILIRYSLISVSQDGKYLSMHSLVQLILEMKFKLDLFSEDNKDETLHAILDTLSTELYFTFSYSFTDWQSISALLPNVLSVLRHAFLKKIHTQSVCTLLHQLGLIQYFDLIQPNQSHKSLLSALVVVKKNPSIPTHIVGVLYSDIAVNAVNLLKFTEAYAHFQQSIEHFKSHNVSITSETMVRVISNLCYTHIRVASNISRHVISLSSFQLLTLADPTFQHSLSNYLKIPQQDTSAILSHHLKLLDTLSRHYGSTHFLVARQHYNIARLYSLLRDHHHAKHHCDIASTLYERSWGCSAIESLYVCRHSSNIDFDLNDIESALQKAKKIFDLTSEYHNTNIISHALSLFHYGALLCEHGEKETALDYLLKAIDAFSQFSKIHAQPLSVLIKCVEFGYVETLKTLLSENLCLITECDDGGNTALLTAALRQRSNMIEILLQHSSSQTEHNYFGATPALCAAYRGNHLFLQEFLKHCPEQSVPEILAATNDIGDGLLSLAVVNNHQETIKYLLDELDLKAQIDRTNVFGYSPLFLAQFYGYSELSSMLLAKTSRKNHTDRFGCTPDQLIKLYRAIYDGASELFIELSSSLTGLCFCGVTAFQLSEAQFSFVLECMPRLPNIKHLIFAHQLFYPAIIDNLVRYVVSSESIETIDLRVLSTPESQNKISNHNAAVLLDAYEHSSSLHELSLLNHPLDDNLSHRLNSLNTFKKSNFEESRSKKISKYVLHFNSDKIFLPKREAECLVHLADGLSAKQTAEKLFLSQSTVEIYIDKLKKRFSCRTKLQLLSIIPASDIEFLRNSLSNSI